MLPAGSYVIVARTTNTAYIAGMSIQVTRNEWNPKDWPLGQNMSDPNFKWPQIEVARSGLPATTVTQLPVWVFPPAVTNLNLTTRSGPLDYEFATRSPVVGVELRRIPVR
jgi:hypothetical protein